MYQKPITFAAAGAALAMAIGLQAGGAQAAGSVIWTDPANNSVFTVGTVVHPTGRADAFGSTGVGLDLMLVLDASGSMGTTLQNAQKAAANALVAALPTSNTSVGVVRFASSATLAIGLTPVPDAAITAAINGTVSSGITATGPGIQAAQNEIVANGTAGRSKQMVVLSDGLSNSGISPVTAATAAKAAGTTVHAIALPGGSTTEMQNIATAGGGSFTNFTNPASLDDLIGIFNGTAGNLVGVKSVDLVLPDGTALLNVGTDGLGNFKVPAPGWAMVLGENIFTAKATFTDGTSASAELRLIGVAPHGVIPLPAAAWLLLTGIAGLGAVSRMRRRA